MTNKRVKMSFLNFHKRVGGTNFHCCVPQCTASSRFNSFLSFHKFPKDPELKKLWVIKTRRDTKPGTKHGRVCSLHFPRGDVTEAQSPGGRRRLRQGAVPLLFQWNNFSLPDPLPGVPERTEEEPNDDAIQSADMSEVENSSEEDFSCDTKSATLDVALSSTEDLHSETDREEMAVGNSDEDDGASFFTGRPSHAEVSQINSTTHEIEQDAGPEAAPQTQVTAMHDQQMSRMFDEVMGLGEFADSSRSSTSLSKTGDQNVAAADKTPGPADDESNDSRQEDRWDDGGEDLSFPQASPTDRASLLTRSAKDAAFDDAIDGLPTFVPEDDEEWNFSLPIGSLEDTDNLKMKQSCVGNDEMKKQRLDDEDEGQRGRNGTNGSADASKEHTPEDSRDSAELNRTGSDDSHRKESKTAAAEDPPMSPIANIKDEPIDEGYEAALLPQGSIAEIKEELEHEEEQLRISSVYSVGGANSFAPPMAPTPVLASALAPAPAPGPTAILFPTRGGTVLQTIPLKPAVTLPSSQTIVSVAPVRPPPPPPIPGSVRCSGCSKVLLKGQTAFQRKGSTQLFCSTMCLTGHLPPATKVIGRSCSQCNKEILQPRDMITIPTEEKTYLYFCGQFCLSVFRHKNKQPEKLLEKWTPEKRLEKKPEKPPEKPAERQQDRCSVCRVINRIEHEVSHQGRVHKLCSDACFVTWRRIRQLALNCCEGCGLYCSSNSTSCQTLTIENIQINFCGLTCVSTFAQSSKKLIDCAKCRKMVVVSTALLERDAKGKVQLFCSQACAERGRPAGHLLNGTSFPCSQCKVTAVPQYHLAMVDGTIRNFCSHDCVSTFRKYGADLINGTSPIKDSGNKESPKLGPASGANSVPSFAQDLQSSVSYPGHQHVNSSVPPLASPYPAMSSPSVPGLGQANSPPNQTEPSDPSKVTCHHCSKRIYTKPLLLSYKSRISVFCSSTCCELYKRQKNIVVTCDSCKLEKVLHDMINCNQQDVFFCSENCKVRYRNNDLWRTCSYCSSVSQKMLHSHYGGKVEEFCRPNCMSQFTVLYYGMGRCDSCRKQGYQSEKLQCLGSVRNFCNITCLLHYCNMYFEKNHRGTSHGTGTAPHNTHVAPTQPNDSSKMNPVIADVVSLANGSATQPNATTDAALTGSIPSSTSEGKSLDHASTQTDAMRSSVPRRRQMKNKSVLCRPFTLDQESMCQFPTTSTDSPAVSDADDSPAAEGKVKMVMVPIPVPVFIPVPVQMYSECTPVPMAMPVPVPVPVMVQPPMKVVQDAWVQMDSVAEGRSLPEEVTLLKPTSEAVGGETTSEGATDSIVAQVEPSTSSHLLLPSSPVMDLESDFPTALLTQRSRLRGMKRTRGGGDGSYPRKRGRKKKGLDRSAVVSSESPVLNQQYGLHAWVHWVRQRLQMDSESLMVNEDLLQCDSTQLSVALAHFVKEVRRPNGQSYTPDSLLYLCLGIQQYLFTNGRMENLFTDELYSPFASQLSGMLRTWSPTPVTRGGLVSSRVHESHLWECKQLGSYSPAVLLNTVLFFCTKGFRLHTLEQHQRLCFSNLASLSKPSAHGGQVQYLEYQPGAAAPSLAEADLKRELLENVSDPRHCPVRLYEFYLSRCPESAKRRPGLLYLQPEKNVTHSPHWYSCQPLESATLQNMLSRVLAVEEVIQERPPSTLKTFAGDR
ncbi:zinc finger MYM-type protein 4-like [Synchiropus splendidus]|uniref:zinc finger MYM-type protein 4-like n=1 Tax=Synchiropus splendidus TaxID=270530 RepID=UPI00237D5F59|nr:zinc finger MYM-type protein 4-like [Synchiropus splendidus]